LACKKTPFRDDVGAILNPRNVFLEQNAAQAIANLEAAGIARPRTCLPRPITSDIAQLIVPIPVL